MSNICMFYATKIYLLYRSEGRQREKERDVARLRDRTRRRDERDSNKQFKSI